MESIIPFTKDLDFKTPVSEITSISLEREFNVSESSIEGNLDVSGEYKSHDVSAHVNPFHFKIPFTIEIPNNLKGLDVKKVIHNKVCNKEKMKESLLEFLKENKN